MKYIKDLVIDPDLYTRLIKGEARLQPGQWFRFGSDFHKSNPPSRWCGVFDGIVYAIHYEGEQSRSRQNHKFMTTIGSQK